MESYHISRCQHKGKIADSQSNESPEHPGRQRFLFPRIKKIQSAGQANPADRVLIGISCQKPHHKPERSKPGWIVHPPIGKVMTRVGNEKQQEKYRGPKIVACPGHPEHGSTKINIECPYAEERQSGDKRGQLSGHPAAQSNPLHSQKEKYHHTSVDHIKPTLAHPEKEHGKEMRHHAASPGHIMQFQ